MARKPAPAGTPLRTAAIGIRTTEDIKEAAERAANADRRSLSQWVEELIVSALDRDKRLAARRRTKR
jgi:uncharacterized protein (DUF1778 family)